MEDVPSKILFLVESIEFPEIGFRGLASRQGCGTLFLPYTRIIPPMTNRVSYAPQDFQKMCKQAERDHEARKLVLLIERVKRQIAERDGSGLKTDKSKSSLSVLNADSALRIPGRPVPVER